MKRLIFLCLALSMFSGQQVFGAMTWDDHTNTKTKKAAVKVTVIDFGQPTAAKKRHHKIGYIYDDGAAVLAASRVHRRELAVSKQEIPHDDF